MKKENKMFLLSNVYAVFLVLIMVFGILIVSSWVKADLVWFYADENGPLVRSEPQECPDFPVIKKCPAGNYHGASHPDRAIKYGYESCLQCHNPNNPVLVNNESVICTQYNPPPENIGRTIVDPVTGQEARDPYTNDKIIGSNHLYILKKGDTVTCSNCHNPHRGEQDFFIFDKRLIHYGCLDCHVGVGDSGLKGGGNGGGDGIAFVKEPWSRLCNDCHSQKNWEDDGHSIHKNKNVQCSSCHINMNDPEPEDSPVPTMSLVKPVHDLCNDCHKIKNWNKEGHKKHKEKRVACSTCHVM